MLAVAVLVAAASIGLALLAQRLLVPPEVTQPPQQPTLLDHLRTINQPLDEVPRLQHSTLEPSFFYREHVLRSQPAIIESFVSSWPAWNLWADDEALAARAGDAPIQVQSIVAGASVFDPEELRQGGADQYEHMSLGQFLRSYRHPDRTNELYAPEVPIPAALAGDVQQPRWAAMMPLDSSIAQPTLWLGGPNQTTPIHRDMYENVYCVVAGAKHLWLAAPWESDRMYPEPGRMHWSQVRHVERYDARAWPLFGEVAWLSATVRAGECLFVPSFWWHHVTGLPPSGAKVASFWYPAAQHNPLWTEAMLWAIGDTGDDELEPAFDAPPAQLPPERVCAAAAELGPRKALPPPLRDYAGSYARLRETSAGEAVYGRNCNVAERHANDCEHYIFFLPDEPARWIVGPTPGLDRASLHALSEHAEPAQHRALLWHGWVEDEWVALPDARVRCTS